MTGEAWILERLPYARGLQYLTLFEHLKGIETEPAQKASIADEML